MRSSGRYGPNASIDSAVTVVLGRKLRFCARLPVRDGLLEVPRLPLAASQPAKLEVATRSAPTSAITPPTFLIRGRTIPLGAPLRGVAGQRVELPNEGVLSGNERVVLRDHGHVARVDRLRDATRIPQFDRADLPTQSRELPVDRGYL